jgi:thioredoxin-related protein
VAKPFTFILLLGLALSTATAQEYKAMGPDIFDPRAKGAELIGAALTRASREHKRVLVLFGANWCPWTRRLHRALSTDAGIGKTLQRSFVLVYVDANTRNDKKRNAAVNEKYSNPLRFGIPVFVVLEHDGALLGTQETQSLAAVTDAEVVERLGRFLNAWARVVPKTTAGQMQHQEYRQHHANYGEEDLETQTEAIAGRFEITALRHVA